MTNFQPASEVFGKKALVETYHFYVVKASNSLLSVTALSDQVPLTTGQRLTVEGVTAILTEVNGSSGVAKVISGDLRSISLSSKGSIDTFAKLVEVDHKITDTSAPIGKLSVLCSTPSFHIAGRLGWSLYLEDSLIAIGNDSKSRGLVQLNGSATWSAGNYRLLVSLYALDRLSITRAATKDWVQEAGKNYIGVGNTNDLEPKLRLL